MKTLRIIATLVGSALCACSGGPGPEPDGGARDAAIAADATTDAPVSADAGTDDADGDGVPAVLDCDDGDPAVGERAERACTGACGMGTERCTRGLWDPCDAPVDCACDTPGEMRLVACARCGMQSERCSDARRWESASMCFDQGECEPAAVEERMTLRCGTEQRLCGATCGWGGWANTVPDGECEPGSWQPCPERGWRNCDETCHWGTDCLCC